MTMRSVSYTHLDVYKRQLLYRAIKADKISSIIFYGPPGTGKTTLAKVIANTTSAEFTQINATVAGKKDMEAVVAQAKQTLGMYQKKTILFVDEIHRFNKGQQDYLLPFVEDGTIILIGATTENPYFEVNSALISRSSIFELQPLSKEDVDVYKRQVCKLSTVPVRTLPILILAIFASRSFASFSFKSSLADNTRRLFA